MNSSAAGVQLVGVSKSFPGRDQRFTIPGLDISIAPGSFVSLLGPSGCGKTTTLRMIAGLEQPTSGVIRVGGRAVFDASARIDVPPAARKLGLVFQNYALWPHMTVAENVAYPLKRARLARPVVEERLNQTLEVLQIGGLRDRYPSELSGGQQQRVALGRALANRDNTTILFDEPLSNLDAQLREELRAELVEVQRELRFTAVFVTHDWVEAMSMSDRVLIMDDGRIVREGTPEGVVDDPRSLAAVRLLGLFNVLVSTNVAKGFVQTALGRLPVLKSEGTGEIALVAATFKQLTLAPSGPRSQVGVQGTVRSRTFEIDRWIITVDVAGTLVKVEVARHGAPGVGDLVAISVEGAVVPVFASSHA